MWQKFERLCPNLFSRQSLNIVLSVIIESYIIMKTLVLFLHLLIAGHITVYVGRVLFRNGRPFLLAMLGEEAITDSVNRLLLTGYYLVNLGYVFVVLTLRSPVETVSDLIVSLSISVGRIMIVLSVMHYFNITAVVLWNKLHHPHKS